MALTSVVMKILERLVLQHIQAAVQDHLDPLQFAYQANRGVDDAISLAIHYALQHLESPGCYVRLLFVDFSSAFNTIVPQKLYEKLLTFRLSPSVCYWLLDFLLQRPQIVKLPQGSSKPLTLSTGTPQGCVLSPLLFCLFTNDCISSSEATQLVKFADDTTVEGLITKGDEAAYRQEVDCMVSWCSSNNLHLNAAKTKEMVVDFRRNREPLVPLTINGETIEQVDSFRFLGSIISCDLTWGENVNVIRVKAQQRLYFLRQLKKFGLSRDILVNFYRAVIESVLTSSLTVWYGATTQQQKDQLQSVVNSAIKITGCDLPSLDSLYEKRLLRKARKIDRDPSHPANSLFELLPSQRRYRTARARTNRFKNSSYPRAILALNQTS